MKVLRILLPLVFIPFVGCSRTATQVSYESDWDFAGSMLKVAERYTGPEGVVLHVGDSNTFEPAYSAWALRGEGKSADEIRLLTWMHAGEGGIRDGWTLCSRPTQIRRSATAANGAQLGHFLVGDHVEYSMVELLSRYNPQILVLMLGTNDATIRRSGSDFRADMDSVIKLILKNGTVPILTTLPPHGARPNQIDTYNRAIQDLARDNKLPLVDLYGEILRRRPHDWKGSLLKSDGLHLTTERAVKDMTEDNLSHSGQLLRAWLTIRLIAEMKEQIFDKLTKPENDTK